MSTNYNIDITAEDKTRGVFNKVNTGLTGVAASATKVKTAIGIAGAALAAFGVAGKIQENIDQFDALAKSARTAGSAASNEAFKGFQVLQQAMGEAGIDAATFERAMLQTTSRLQEGLEGGEAFSEIVSKMGGSITDANGKLADGATVMKEMVNALNNGTISTDEFAKVVGGRAGPLIQAQFASLNTSAEALEATLSDVEANSNIVSLDAANNAEKFNDTVGRLKNAFGQLMTDALEPLMPILVDLAERILANMPAIIEKVKAGFDALSPVFQFIGTLLTEVVAPVLGKVFEGLGLIFDAINPLVEQALPALKSGFDAIVNTIQSVVDWFSKAYDKIVAIGQAAIDLKNKVTGNITAMADSVTSTVSDMADSATQSFYDMWDEVVGHSIVPDMVDAVIDEFKRQERDVVRVTNDTTTAVTRDFAKMGKSVQDDFIDTLADSLSDGKLELNDFRGFFKKTLTTMLEDAFNGGNGLQQMFAQTFDGIGSIFGQATSWLWDAGSSLFSGLGSIFSSGLGSIIDMVSGWGSSLGGVFGSIFNGIGGLFGGGGGSLLGSIASGIGSLFGGFFADGGHLPAGQFGIVGEAGPEIITGPANITPMDKVSSGGSGASVNITIQAIDTQTGTQFLLNNKKQIEGIIQNAYNRRGKQGIV